MATIATVLPLALPILQALPQIVMAVESLFGKGNGAAKQTAAVKMVDALHNAMVDAGKATGPAPDTPMVQNAIDSVVAALNTQGVLKGSATSMMPAQTVATAQADKVALALAQGLVAVLQSKS